jgi:hypothetical protein
MNADDDGVVEAFTIMRILSTSEDDLRALALRNFIKVLNEDLVSLILEWNEHNLIRADRKIDSIYKDLLVKVIPDIEIKEAKERADTGKKTGEKKMDVQWTTNGRHRLGKVRLGKERRDTSLSKKYLEKIPEEDLKYLTQRFFITRKEIINKAESLNLYCEAKGKTYKNYKSFLLNAIKKDFPEREQEEHKEVLPVVKYKDRSKAINELKSKLNKSIFIK